MLVVLGEPALTGVPRCLDLLDSWHDVQILDTEPLPTDSTSVGLGLTGPCSMVPVAGALSSPYPWLCSVLAGRLRLFRVGYAWRRSRAGQSAVRGW